MQPFSGKPDRLIPRRSWGTLRTSRRDSRCTRPRRTRHPSLQKKGSDAWIDVAPVPGCVTAHVCHKRGLVIGPHFRSVPLRRARLTHHMAGTTFRIAEHCGKAVDGSTATDPAQKLLSARSFRIRSSSACSATRRLSCPFSRSSPFGCFTSSPPHSTELISPESVRFAH